MDHTLASVRSVGWAMTTAKHSAIFPRSAESNAHRVRIGPTRVGKWTYTGWTPDKTATLQHEGREVDLHYSSSIFEDFLESMSRIQNEFVLRSPDAGPFKKSIREGSGQISRV